MLLTVLAKQFSDSSKSKQPPTAFQRSGVFDNDYGWSLLCVYFISGHSLTTCLINIRHSFFEHSDSAPAAAVILS